MAITDNLTVGYDVDESSGNAADVLGSLTATNVNSVTYTTGKINNCASFVSNASGRLETSSTSLISGTNNFSISLWVKKTSGAGFFCSQRNTYPGFNWQFVYNADKIYFTIGGSGNLFEADSISLDTNWHHLVVTRSGNSFTLYKDGSSVSTGTDTSSIGTGQTFCIGDDKAGDGFAFNGLIDAFYVWSRAISSTEVTTLYNSGNGLQYPFSTSSIKTINGLAIASVKTVNSLAIASVKTWNGLA